MKPLWNLYHQTIPPFLQEFAAVPPVQRLKEVGMNCGCEYTSFPLFRALPPYSRYDHSMGAALIVWHFTADVKQSLAALFHDVATPVFAHVVDFLNGDHMRQESTEEGTAACLASSPELARLLRGHGISLEEISDDRRYPIANNSSPALSADRLEYTMGNLLYYGLADLRTLRSLYGDLQVGCDERGNPELVFQTPETASAFARAALQTARIYVADEDRFAMQALADLLRGALERGVLSRADLQKTEPAVIEQLRQDEICGAEWSRFCGYSRISRSDTPRNGEYWVQVAAKKRWINPIAAGRGRVAQWDAAFAAEAERLQKTEFSHWLHGE